MFNREKPVKRKDKISRIKQFLSGEDVFNEVLPLSRGLAVLTTDELNKVRLLQEYGVEPIEGMAFEQDGVKIDFREWQRINEKFKSAVIMLPARVKDTKAEITPMLWHEERSYETKTYYEDPTIPGVHYASAENCPEALPDSTDVAYSTNVNDYTENNEALETPRNRSAKTVSKDQHRRLFLHGINEQMKQDKVRRDKMNQWSMMNGSLRPF